MGMRISRDRIASMVAPRGTQDGVGDDRRAVRRTEAAGRLLHRCTNPLATYKPPAAIAEGADTPAMAYSRTALTRSALGWQPGTISPLRPVCHLALPFAHAQAPIRHPSASLRSATVKIAPVCVTCWPRTLNVIVAGSTTYALSPVTLLCTGSPSVKKYSEAPCCSPSISTSRYQS